MKTKWVAYAFNAVEFGNAVKDCISSLGIVDMSQLTGVSGKTLAQWAMGKHHPEYPHPSMTNFLMVCNIMDRNPADFFTTEE